MPILYDWPLEWPIETVVWQGDLDEANTYWTQPRTLPKGKYVFITDFSAVSDWIFWAVQGLQNLKLFIEQYQEKGIDGWEWKGKKLYVYITEASPVAPAIIAGIIYIIIAALIVLGLYLVKDIFVTVRQAVTELGVSGKILVAGIGISLIGGTVVTLAKGAK